MSATLQLVAPGIDLSKTLERVLPKKQQRIPISPPELEALRTTLGARLKVHPPAIKPKANDRRAVDQRSKLQAVTGASDISGLVGESGKLVGDVDSGIQILRDMRAQLGETLPPDQDLERICAERGIDRASAAYEPFRAPVLQLLKLSGSKGASSIKEGEHHKCSAMVTCW